MRSLSGGILSELGKPEGGSGGFKGLSACHGCLVSGFLCTMEGSLSVRVLCTRSL